MTLKFAQQGATLDHRETSVRMFSVHLSGTEISHAPVSEAPAPQEIVVQSMRRITMIAPGACDDFQGRLQSVSSLRGLRQKFAFGFSAAARRGCGAGALAVERLRQYRP